MIDLGYIPDKALEANRRLAWAKVYAAREDTRHAMLWSAELAEWLRQLAPDAEPPLALRQLLEAIDAAITPGERLRIRRYVTWTRNHPDFDPTPEPDEHEGEDLLCR